LKSLSHSGRNVSEGYVDIRGWEVRTETGKKLGKADDLLFDDTNHKVRYIVLNLAENELHLKVRSVVVPIGVADIKEKPKQVLLQGMLPDQIATLPDYTGDGLEFK